MKTILSVRRHHYLERVGIFLIVIALVAGIVSCGGDEVGPYDLTMAADPAGGGTVTDETNGSPYEEGTAVSIKAVTAAGYEFDGWTAPAGEFADASAEETIFTMPAQDVTVTANFEPTPLDHFRGYGIDMATMPYVGENVTLEDQFGTFTVTVGIGWAIANAVNKTHDGVTALIANDDNHLMGYTLEGVEPQWWRVTVDNQFGTQELTVAGPIGLFVPTQKVEPGGHEPPEGLDYFLGYEVIDPQRLDERVDLEDQFGRDEDVLVTQPKAFANPVRVTHDGEVTEIVNQDAHLMVYFTLVEGASLEQHDVVVNNKFGQQQFIVTEQDEGFLAVPSEKIDSEQMAPPLDHFRCYSADYYTMPDPGEVVELTTDDFGTFNATVGLGTALCNPVEKAVNEIAAWEWVPISHPDYHLMLYMLEDVDPAPDQWVVEVNNQFGEQELQLCGPLALAVPTQKEGHNPPVGLDYFLVYNVTNSPSMNVVVDLTDQFGGGDNNFEMVEPFAFAFGIPVQITHDGQVTQIENSDDHLVFYWIRDEDAPPQVTVHTVKLSNLFGQFTLDVQETSEALLAVPSEKITWEPL